MLRLGHRNHFDVLRTVAAALVIVGHAFVLTGHTPVPRLLGTPLHEVGLFVFFATSGFLIMQSRRRLPTLRVFLAHRAARILPALWIVVPVTVLVVGPLLSTVSAVEFASAGETWRYLSNAVLIAQYDLPGVFDDNPVSTVNGSLWTLGVEVCCYLLVAVAGFLRHALRICSLVVAGALLVLMTFVQDPDGASGPSDVAVVFVLGALCAHLPAARRPWWTGAATVVGVVLMASPVTAAVQHVGSWAAIAGAAVLVGELRRGPLTRWGSLGDPSYGMYLWGYLVQQVVVDSAGPQAAWANIAVSLPIACALGYLSWFAVERPCLQRVRGGLDRRGGGDRRSGADRSVTSRTPAPVRS